MPSLSYNLFWERLLELKQNLVEQNLSGRVQNGSWRILEEDFAALFDVTVGRHIKASGGSCDQLIRGDGQQQQVQRAAGAREPPPQQQHGQSPRARNPRDQTEHGDVDDGVLRGIGTAGADPARAAALAGAHDPRGTAPHG